MGLVIVGSIAFDGVKTPYGEVDKVLGGSAIYASMASKHFCKTHIVGIVGEDFSKCHFDMLQKNNIGYEGLEVVPGKTFYWKGVYNDLNRAETLDTQLNVFANFDPRIPSDYRKCEYLFLGNIDPDLQLRVLDQMDNTKITACDTMNFWIEGKREKLLEVISKIDILFINDDEVKMLTGENNIFVAAEAAGKLGPQLIIVKRGEYGSMAAAKDFIFFAPVYPVKNVIDPTGAGDSFAGGFMGYLSAQKNYNKTSIKNAIIYGTVMASFSIESFSLDKLREIDLKNIEARKESVIKNIKI
jgi:sugar/nucleoside kinase (ribokinase family)